MKTDQLIDSLVADRDRPSLPPQRGLRFALPAAVAIAIGVFVYCLDMRADFGAAVESWRYLLKLLTAALIAIAGGLALLHLAQPEHAAARVLRLLPLAILPLLLGFALEGMMIPADLWSTAAMGQGALYCLFYVPVLTLAPLAATLWAMGRGAPQSPMLGGAIAGLAAGGVGAFVYSIHCNNDSPFYVAIWYLGGIAIVTLLGALIGQRYLRW